MNHENENANPNPSNPFVAEALEAFPPGDVEKFWGMDEKTFCMLMHLSPFANYVVPSSGLILPIVMWATNKDQSPMIDQHGRNIFNFMLSMFIYSIALLFLTLIMAFLTAIAIGMPVGLFIGIPLIMVLGIAAIVLPILAAVKASKGEHWPYPLCIRFFK